jgi:hypothetical protein|tara:strand:+ start:1239 stop:2294 length:1056 start_codon:yes stop_codon:yes gene_type:complete
MNNKTFVWACDLEKFRGEGVLAWSFIFKLIYFTKKKNKFYEIESFKKLFIVKNDKYISKKNTVTSKLDFNLKYILPYYGVLRCWYKYFKGYNVCYVNYLPLWNFLIFILLPPKTIYGPITGGYYFDGSKNFDYYIRKFFFPIFFKLSLTFINSSRILLFSTDLLSKFINKKKFQKVFFNFVLVNYIPLKKNNLKKIYDLVVYYRIHKNKSNLKIISLVKKLLLKKYKIIVVGDRLNILGLKNKTNISKVQLFKIIKKSKFALNSGENSLSLFMFDCISNGAKTFVNKKSMSKILDKNKLVIPVDFHDQKSFIKNVEKNISKNKLLISKSNKLIYYKKKINLQLENYFSQYI